MTTFFVLFGAIGIALIALRSGLILLTVSGESMSPTLMDGARVLSKRVFIRRQLVQGQIIIVKRLTEPNLGMPPSKFGRLFPKESQLFVKRLIGMPGDTVKIPLAQLEAMPSTFLPADFRERFDAEGQAIWRVPADHYFVKGDGHFSVDSVSWGPIPFSEIRGVVIAKLPERNNANRF